MPAKEHEDFDIHSLAVYLHLTPPQVEKLAEREKIPGRKVGGAWRFSRNEIHHWMEGRMGLLDDAELAQVEGMLQKQAEKAGDEAVTVAALLRPEAISLPLVARTRGSVITAMAELAGGTGLLWHPAKMAESVRAREDMQPTALDSGVALLHPRRPLTGILAEPLLALGATSQGIPFGGSRGMLTDIFFLICSTSDRGHLRTLARLSRLIADEEILAAIRSATDPAELHRLLAEQEEQYDA